MPQRRLYHRNARASNTSRCAAALSASPATASARIASGGVDHRPAWPESQIARDAGSGTNFEPLRSGRLVLISQQAIEAVKRECRMVRP